MAYYGMQQVGSLYESQLAALEAVREAQFEAIRASPTLTSDEAREYLMHGIARRLRVLAHCLQRVYESYPPEIEQPPAAEHVQDAQVCIHAFVINTSGLLDNLAWAFVHRHGLFKAIGSRLRVGLFHPDTQKFLPAELRNYLQKDVVVKWQERYLTYFRDALAHRIPLYIPPAQITNDDAQRIAEINLQIDEAAKQGDFESATHLLDEIDRIGTPMPVFVQAFVAETPQLVPFHGQLVSDANAMVELVRLFLAHWHSVEQP